MAQLPLDSSCQAEYSDGYIHDETSHNDASPYDKTKNILNDIIEKRPEAEHGQMVRFSVFWKNRRYDVRWVDLPDNARPIRFRDGYFTKDVDSGNEISGWSAIRVGYQYNDENGKNIQEVMNL